MRTLTIALVLSTACFGCDELLAEPRTPIGHGAGTDLDPRPLTTWEDDVLVEPTVTLDDDEPDSEFVRAWLGE